MATKKFDFLENNPYKWMEKEISTNREGNAETGLKLRYRKMELHTQTAVQSQSQQIRMFIPKQQQY